MPRSLTIIALVCSVLAFLYSLMGVAMAYWVAAVPGNSPERIRLNFAVWGTASVITFALVVFFAWRSIRRSGR